MERPGMASTYRNKRNYVPVPPKIPPAMLKGIRKVADRQFSNMSSVIRQAINKFLEAQGINWRGERTKPAKKR
jgi:Arc/MetJ-type ribon-helix-helix transcriptional regulator